MSRIRPRRKPRRKRPELFHYTKEAVKIFRDGREVCNTRTVSGQREYKRRIAAMMKRQGGLCCNCQILIVGKPTFEHENGRGAGKQDDRIEVDGKPQNGASHWVCNYERGSKRTPIWHGSPETVPAKERKA